MKCGYVLYFEQHSYGFIVYFLLINNIHAMLLCFFKITMKSYIFFCYICVSLSLSLSQQASKTICEYYYP